MNIKQGTCILTEKPFVFVLKSKYRIERCDNCLGSTGKVLKCSGCQYVYYCNRECQMEAWPQHKTECPRLKTIIPRIVPDAARILARIILKLKQGGDLEKGYYTETSYRKFKDLMSHYPDLKADARRMEHLESLASVLKVLLGEASVPNSSELLGIYGRLVVNGFNILDGEMNSVGTGIYLGVSIVDHNCTPNAVATFEGSTLFIRTLQDMQCLDWSKIFISYIDLLSTPENRRKDLKENYYFLCICSKCIDPNESIEMVAAACPNIDCNEPLNLRDGAKKCEKCLTVVTDEFKEQYEEIMSFTETQLINMKDVASLTEKNIKADLDICKICLRRQKNILHRLNLLYVKTLDFAFESAIDIGKWEDALIFGKLLLPGFRKYNGDLNPLLGLLYMKIGKILIFLGHTKEAGDYLRNAIQILKITHGENHSLYKNQLIPLLMQASADCS